MQTPDSLPSLVVAESAAAGMRRTSRSSRRRTIIADLERAVSMQYPVGIDRDQGEWGNRTYGYVASVGESWVVLQQLVHSVYVGGYDVLRLDDITGVIDDREAGFVERAVAALGRPPVTFHLPHDAGVKDLLLAAAEHSDLISVHLEAQWDSPRLVGHLGHLGARKFELQLINARGVWGDELWPWWYKDVTSVSFGSRYEAALERFGDERPHPVASRSPRTGPCTCGCPAHPLDRRDVDDES